MKNKTLRLIAIREIIQKESVGSQEELIHFLREKGFDLTQATLSRDLKTLKVSKIANEEGIYEYALPENSIPSTNLETGRINFLADGFRTIDFSENLAVIKTLPGYANSIAAVIDNANPFEILGTIAGDDTILIIIREGLSRKQIIDSLLNIMPKIKEKLG